MSFFRSVCYGWLTASLTHTRVIEPQKGKAGEAGIGSFLPAAQSHCLTGEGNKHLRYFSIAVTEATSRRSGLFWANRSGKIRVRHHHDWKMLQQAPSMLAGIAQSSPLKSQTGSRALAGDGTWLLKSQSAPPVTHFPPAKPHLLTLPKQHCPLGTQQSNVPDLSRASHTNQHREGAEPPFHPQHSEYGGGFAYSVFKTIYFNSGFCCECLWDLAYSRHRIHSFAK